MKQYYQYGDATWIPISRVQSKGRLVMIITIMMVKITMMQSMVREKDDNDNMQKYNKNAYKITFFLLFSLSQCLHLLYQKYLYQLLMYGIR